MSAGNPTDSWENESETPSSIVSESRASLVPMHNQPSNYHHRWRRNYAHSAHPLTQRLSRAWGDDEPMGRAEEQALARAYQATHRRLRHTMLQIDGVVEQAVQILHDLAACRRRLDRVLDVSPKDAHRKSNLRSSIPGIIAQVQAIRAENQRTFQHALARSRNLPGRSQWRSISERRQIISGLLEQLPFRHQILNQLASNLWQTTRELMPAAHPTAEDHLAQCVQRQDTFESLSARLRKLHYQKSRCEELRSRLALGHLRFVFKIAAEYQGAYTDINDAFQEGMAGLLKAIQRFDPERNLRLTTYAEWWIRQEIRQSLPACLGALRIPLQARSHVRQLKENTEHLAHAQRHLPTDEDIAGRMSLSSSDLVRLVRLSRPAISLDDGGHPDAQRSQLRDQIQAPVSPLSADRDYAALSVEHLLAVLDGRESEILRLRYGIGCEQGLTLSELAEIHNLSRERIRQIELAALQKLRRLPLVERLKSALSEASTTGYQDLEDELENPPDSNAATGRRE